MTQALKIHKVYPMIPLLVNSKSEQAVPLSVDGAAYTELHLFTEMGFKQTFLITYYTKLFIATRLSASFTRTTSEYMVI
jgi:hypothetical protein